MNLCCKSSIFKSMKISGYVTLFSIVILFSLFRLDYNKLGSHYFSLLALQLSNTAPATGFSAPKPLIHTALTLKSVKG